MLTDSTRTESSSYSRRWLAGAAVRLSNFGSHPVGSVPSMLSGICWLMLSSRKIELQSLKRFRKRLEALHIDDMLRSRMRSQRKNEALQIDAAMKKPIR